ncbi:MULTISPECIES: ferritin-like domain-containing protein [Aphanothece]|uniref:ferritin-like domain-containing protein n=1 Tax=Aphanothece TaxID=1121 RepID=UPI0039850401
MPVTYPKKLSNNLSAREVMDQVVQKRDVQMLFLNSYRFNEQRSCSELTNLIEFLDGEPAELVRDLSHHVNDEARHAVWLTDLLVELGEPIGNPPTSSYIDELNRLLDKNESTLRKEDGIVAALASINATEKRGCQTFSAHIHALKKAPPTEENQKIRSTLERILPEEASHVRWGNRWLSRIARQSPAHRQRVDEAKHRYSLIEHAAYAAGMDITAGAELRRLANLVDIANTIPAWQRPAYLLERLPQTLLAPDLQKSRFLAARRVWQEKPELFFDTFVPMFLSGLQGRAPGRN